MMPLAWALAGRGHALRVVIPPWDDPTATPGATFTATPEGGSVEVVTLPLPRTAPRLPALTYSLVKRALAPFELAGMGVNAQPEVVHVFKPVGYSGLAGLVLQAKHTRWVLDMDDWEGPGGWVDANRYTPAQKIAATLLEALLPCMASVVTVASRALEARAWDFGLPRRRVLYMPNGIWSGKYAPWLDVERAPRDAPTILLYTRFAEFPVEWPLDVLRRVRREHPTARLLIVGGGFFGEERALLTEAERTGLGGHVEIAGHVDEADLPRLLRRAGVALYPMSDNLLNRAKSPVKVLEPMLLGLPIVAHRVGQAAEFIGDAGVLVAPGNLDAMAAAVSALLDDPQRSADLGRRARRRVLTRFNWQRLCLQAEKAYG